MTSRIRKKHDSYVNELMLNEYLTLLLTYQIADTMRPYHVIIAVLGKSKLSTKIIPFKIYGHYFN